MGLREKLMMKQWIIKALSTLFFKQSFGNKLLIHERYSIVLHTNLFKYLTVIGGTSSSSFNGIRPARNEDNFAINFLGYELSVTFFYEYDIS